MKFLIYLVAVVVAQNATNTSFKDEDIIPCSVDLDCPMLPFYSCQDKICTHKSIFPMHVSEFIGIMILPVLLAFANVGGVGGGGIIIPLTMSLFRFTMKSSISISVFCIMCGAIVRFFYQWTEKHPDKNSTMVEYQIVIVMMPMVLVGSFVGVLVNIYLPGLILAIVLTLHFIFFLVKGLHKGRKMYVKETKVLSSIKEGTELKAVNEQPNLEVDPVDRESLDKLLEAESTVCGNWRKHLLAVSTIFLSLMVNFLRGSRKSPSILAAEKCGAIDWSLFCAFVVVMGVLTFVGVTINRREQALKRRCGHPVLDSEIEFSGKQLVLFLSCAFVGGWVAGALGLGGGATFNTLMQAMGVPPSVSTSTGMYMIMLSTFASSVMYISYGRVNIEYSIWIGFWTSLGILVGLRITKQVIARTKRQSLIVFIFCGVMCMSAVMVPIFQYIEVKNKLAQNKPIWEFSDICK
jgi:uncharacterized membrane protein YfcA